MNAVGLHSLSSTRALQTPDPPNKATMRVLNALRIGCVADAIKWLRELTDEVSLAPPWKDYLEARVLLEQGDFVRAKAMAQRAASAALHLGLSNPQHPVLIRLAAAALELEGAALRRQDLPLAAHRVHLAALDLRREHGTSIEQCESALSLGSCAQWTGDAAAAEHWYRLASNLEVADGHHAQQKSHALIRLSGLMTQLSRHEEAITAAKQAQNTLIENLPGDVDTVCAGLHLAQAKISHAATLLTENPDLAKSLLEEVSQALKVTRDDLQGFGPTVNEELVWCDEQIDFTDMLRQTIASMS